MSTSLPQTPPSPTGTPSELDNLTPEPGSFIGLLDAGLPASTLGSRVGLDWLQSAACGELDEEMREDGESAGALSLFFVDAGHVIDEETNRMCRVLCPVRHECLVHAYTGGPGGSMLGGGYAGGFSLGQRRGMTLRDALVHAELDTVSLVSGELPSNSTNHDMADHALADNDRTEHPVVEYTPVEYVDGEHILGADGVEIDGE